MKFQFIANIYKDKPNEPGAPVFTSQSKDRSLPCQVYVTTIAIASVNYNFIKQSG